MKNLCSEDKLALIRTLCKEHKITALEISKGAVMTLAAAKRLVGPIVYKPQNRILDHALHYIECRLSLSKPRRDLVSTLRAELAARDAVIVMQEEKIKWLQNSCC